MERFLSNLLLLLLVAIGAAVWLSQGDRLTWLEGLAPTHALAATSADDAASSDTASKHDAPAFSPPVAPQVASQSPGSGTTSQAAPAANTSIAGPRAESSASLTGKIIEPPPREEDPLAVPPPVDFLPPVVPPEASQTAVPPVRPNKNQNTAGQPTASASTELFPAPIIDRPLVPLPRGPQGVAPQRAPHHNVNGPTDIPVGPLGPVGAPPATAAAGSGGASAAPTQLLSATPVANVNGDVILAGDVFPAVDRVLAERFANIPDDKRDEVRIQLAKQRLTQLIEMQILYNDAIRAVPKENLPLIDKQLNQQFQEEELPRMMEAAKVESAQQFDEYLRLHGDSIERAKRRYRHEILARQWLGRQAVKESEITHEEMLKYYHEHEESFAFPSRARWEQLTVRYSSVADPPEARRKIAWMGNQVIDGAPFAELAKNYSSGATASKGGQRDWTTKGSLVSEELDRALFTLPVGYLSPIIEHETGLSIVRVVERQNAGKTSFLDAQAGIKEEIRKERHDDSRREYLDRLQKQARIWNIFDDPGAEAMFASRPKNSTQR